MQRDGYCNPCRKLTFDSGSALPGSPSHMGVAEICSDQGIVLVVFLAKRERKRETHRERERDREREIDR